MSDAKEITTTMWQDSHSGLRGHKLMTKELGEKIPALYANENTEDYDTVLAHVKLFSPTPTGPGSSPSGTHGPERASAWCRGSRRSLATSI